MNTRTRLAGMLGLALVPLLATAACGSDAGAPSSESRPAASESRPAAPSATRAAAEPAKAPAPGREPVVTSASAATDLRDGRHLAHVESVSVSARRVTVDVVQLFTGAQAARAAAEDGAAEVPPPNDYYIRNASPKVRTLSVVPAAPVTVNVHGARESGSSTKDVGRTLAQLAAIPGLDDGVFWVTVDGGRVTRIAEMYVP